MRQHKLARKRRIKENWKENKNYKERNEETGVREGEMKEERK